MDQSQSQMDSGTMAARVLVLVIAVVVAVHCDESGQYVPDDEGRYTPDNSGEYVPDFSGNYVHDPSGTYKGDGTGGYTAQSSGPAVRSTFNLNSLIPAAPARTSFSNAFGSSAAESSQSASYAQARSPDAKWRILKYVNDVDLDGYNWAYETENGISAEETGKLANVGTKDEALRARGFYKYTGPDNTPYSISYTADENGFVAAGNHIPTPVPLPEALVKAIEFHKKAIAEASNRQ